VGLVLRSRFVLIATALLFVFLGELRGLIEPPCQGTYFTWADKSSAGKALSDLPCGPLHISGADVSKSCSDEIA